MTSYIIEYSDGPNTKMPGAAYPDLFQRLEREAHAREIELTRDARLGTLGSPYRFLEVVRGRPEQVRRYGDLVHELFGGALRVRRGYPVAPPRSRGSQRPARGDRVHTAGVGSFPASDAPPW